MNLPSGKPLALETLAPRSRSCRGWPYPKTLSVSLGHELHSLSPPELFDNFRREDDDPLSVLPAAEMTTELLLKLIITMRAYLDGIQSTVGIATLREREAKLLYLFEVMLELRLSPDPRTMDKDEIDALVMWMRERNLGLAYQAKLWQYVRGLLAFVGNNILDVMKARGQWKPPKRAYRPVTVKDDSWFSATVARLANETGWRPRMVLAASPKGISTSSGGSSRFATRRAKAPGLWTGSGSASSLRCDRSSWTILTSGQLGCASLASI